METSVAFGGSTFKLTQQNLYFGSRSVAVNNEEMRDRIRTAIENDDLLGLRDLFVEHGGDIRKKRR